MLMKTCKRMVTTVTVAMLLALVNSGCASRQVEVKDTWSASADRSSQAATRAEDAAKRAEAAAARMEAAAQKIENIAGTYDSSLRKSLNK